MSVDTLIGNLIAAIEANTTALNKLLGAAAATAGATKAGATKVGAAPAADDGEETEAPKRGRPKGSTKATPAKGKTVTEEAMVEAAKKFLDQAGKDGDEYAERRDEIKAIAKTFGAAKFSAIPEESRASALNALANAESKFQNDDEDGDDEDGDDL